MKIICNIKIEEENNRPYLRLRDLKKNDIYNSYASSLYLIELNSLDIILSIYSGKNNKVGDIC